MCFCCSWPQEKLGKEGYNAGFEKLKADNTIMKPCAGFCKDVVERAGGDVAAIAKLPCHKAYELMDTLYLPNKLKVRSGRNDCGGVSMLGMQVPCLT
jgi:hypothetical protein